MCIKQAVNISSRQDDEERNFSICRTGPGAVKIRPGGASGNTGLSGPFFLFE
jgi:hypothetical protein